jgi:hypothetical protein
MGDIMRRTDAIVGAVALVIGGYALKGALALGYYYNGAPGPGFFPRFLSLLLLLLGGAQLVQAILPKRGQAQGGDPEPDSAGADVATAAPDGAHADVATAVPASRKYLRVAGVMTGWIVSVALLDRLGFLIAMALLVLYLNVVVDGKRGWRPVAAAILMPSAIYYAFTRFLQIPLPAGIFGF